MYDLYYPSLTNQKLPRGMIGTEQMPDIFWCETNAGHFLVRNKCRTFFGAEQIPDIFGAEQMPDIFWCGPNAGHSLVHLWVPRLGTHNSPIRLPKHRARGKKAAARVPLRAPGGTAD